MGEFLDLFGGVVPQHRWKRGRPPHQPTRETRATAARLLIAGCPKGEIARALKITMPTFRRHYLRINLEKKVDAGGVGK